MNAATLTTDHTAEFDRLAAAVGAARSMDARREARHRLQAAIEANPAAWDAYTEAKAEEIDDPAKGWTFAGWKCRVRRNAYGIYSGEIRSATSAGWYCPPQIGGGFGREIAYRLLRYVPYV